MHYFIRYDQKSGDVVGYSRSTRKDITLTPRSTGEGIVEVTSEPMVKELEDFNPLASRLTGTVHANELHRLKVEPRYSGRIAVAANRPDLDGDGKPELAADGASTTDITAMLLNRDGTPAKDGVRVRFRVNRGSLSAREARTANGKALVTWQAPAETVEARVIVSADGFEDGSLTLEFIPPDEYRTLSAKK